MPDVTLQSLVGGGGRPRLAPELSYPSALSPGNLYKQVTINPAGVLTTALSLTGKWQIGLMEFGNLTAETVTVKMSVDGVLIWDSTFTCSISIPLNGRITNNQPMASDFECQSSLLLELRTATDTSVTFSYQARPIL